MLPASYTEYPPAPSARYGPFLTWTFPSWTCTVLAASGSPSELAPRFRFHRIDDEADPDIAIIETLRPKLVK
jgi:hypothetical protein